MNDQNEKLLLQFKSDDEAYWELFKQYYPKLKLFADKMLEDEVAAEDVAITSIENLKKCSFEVTSLQLLNTLLYKFAKNACIDEIRKRKSHLNFVKESRKITSNEEHPFSLFTLSETMSLIYQEIEKLPDQRKTVFKMRYIEDLDYKEIEQKTGLKYQTVVNHVNDALRDLRIAFDKSKHLYEFLLCWLICSH